MKYEHRKGTLNKEYVSWPGFSIETTTGSGAEKLVNELNRLDTELVRTRAELQEKQNINDELRRDLASQALDLQAQIEAKCNALRKVTDLEALGVELELKLKGTPTNRALKQRLSVRTGQVSELLDVLERAQGILADYIEPNGCVKPRQALTDLLDVLDDGELVNRMRNLRELIGVKNNGSVELTKEQKSQVLSALGLAAHYYPGIWPESLRTAYENACRILGASEDGDVARKFSEVGDEVLVKLRRGPDGKQYLAGLGIGIPNGVHWRSEPFAVQADRVYVNGACIEKSAISATELGEWLHERINNVINNTTNHFAPEPKASKKQLGALRDAIEELGLQSVPTKHLCKLLKKLS